MSLLQGQNVATTSYLDGLGLPYSELLNDIKIWVTAGGINRTLRDAIVDKVMGIKGTAGAKIRKFGSFITDSSMPAVGGLENPVTVSGKMFIGTNDWQVRASTYFLVSVDGVFWPERDEDNTESWSRDTINKKIILNKNLSGSAQQVIIIQFGGVAPPTSSVELNTGLRPIHEAFIRGDQIVGRNVSILSKTSTEIILETDFDTETENTIVLYVDGKFVPRAIAGLNGIRFSSLSSKKFKLTDYGTATEIYLIEYPVESTIDGSGSIVVQMDRFIKNYTVLSSDRNTWAIGVDDAGNIFTNDSFEDVSESILLRDDNFNIVGITCDVEGRPIVDTSTTYGFVFENIILKSPLNKFFKLGATASGEVYVTEIANQKSFFIENYNGDEVFGLSHDNLGGTLHLPEITSLEDALEVVADPDYAYLSSIVIAGEKRIVCWNPIKGKWDLGQNIDIAVKGEVVQSVRPLEDIKALHGGEWVKLDGSVIPTTHPFYDFLSSQFMEFGKVALPDLTHYDFKFGMGIYSNGEKFAHPVGFTADHVLFVATSLALSSYGPGEYQFRSGFRIETDGIMALHDNGNPVNLICGYKKNMGIYKYLRVS